MKMLKTLAMAALAPTLIKAVEEGYEWMCKQFSNEPDNKPVNEIYEPGCTRFTPAMKLRIIREHNRYLRTKENTEGTPMVNTVQLKNYLNKTLRMNKSRSSYSRVWNKK